MDWVIRILDIIFYVILRNSDDYEYIEGENIKREKWQRKHSEYRQPARINSHENMTRQKRCSSGVVFGTGNSLIFRRCDSIGDRPSAEIR